MKHWPLLGIILILLYFLFDRFLGSYLNCLIDHRSGFFLLDSREAVHEACFQRLNPFHL